MHLLYDGSNCQPQPLLYCTLHKYNLKSHFWPQNVCISNPKEQELHSNEQHVILNVVLVVLILDLVNAIRNLICASLFEP